MFKRIVSGALKDAAEGKYGKGPAAAYAFLDQHALWLSGALSFVYAAVWGYGQLNPNEQWAQTAARDIAVVAAVLASGGLPVQLHASEPPKQP